MSLAARESSESEFCVAHLHDFKFVSGRSVFPPLVYTIWNRSPSPNRTCTATLYLITISLLIIAVFFYTNLLFFHSLCYFGQALPCILYGSIELHHLQESFMSRFTGFLCLLRRWHGPESHGHRKQRACGAHFCFVSVFIRYFHACQGEF